VSATKTWQTHLQLSHYLWTIPKAAKEPASLTHSIMGQKCNKTVFRHRDSSKISPKPITDNKGKLSSLLRHLVDTAGAVVTVFANPACRQVGVPAFLTDK